MRVGIMLLLNLIFSGLLCILFPAVALATTVDMVGYSFTSFRGSSPETIMVELSKIGMGNINQSEPANTFVVGHKVFVTEYRFGIISSRAFSPVASLTSSTSGVSGQNNLPLSVLDRPLFYPNPLRQSGTSGQKPFLQYTLSKDAPIEVRFYDMRGYEILRVRYAAGQAGGIGGYNKLWMTQDTFNGKTLPSGPYFYLILSAEQTLAKGKFMVQPS